MPSTDLVVIDLALVPEVMCDATYDLCRCTLAEHDSPHECDCGGSWTYDENGKFVVVRYPTPNDPFLSILLGGFM